MKTLSGPRADYSVLVASGGYQRLNSPPVLAAARLVNRVHFSVGITFRKPIDELKIQGLASMI